MTSCQRTFWDDEFRSDMDAKRLARRSDPETSHEAAREAVESGRLSKQCEQILERLRCGPAPSSELAAIAQKYTGRISDLRKRGYRIDARHDGGEWWYVLKES
jgi:hypothetical protein